MRFVVRCLHVCVAFLYHLWLMLARLNPSRFLAACTLLLSSIQTVVFLSCVHWIFFFFVISALHFWYLCLVRARPSYIVSLACLFPARSLCPQCSRGVIRRSNVVARRHHGSTSRWAHRCSGLWRWTVPSYKNDSNARLFNLPLIFCCFGLRLFFLFQPFYSQV